MQLHDSKKCPPTPQIVHFLVLIYQEKYLLWKAYLTENDCTRDVDDKKSHRPQPVAFLGSIIWWVGQGPTLTNHPCGSFYFAKLMLTKSPLLFRT
jgi:hypothetical protein